MKKIIILFFTVSFVANVFSQTNYFNNYNNPNGTWASSFNIYPTSSGYVSAGVMGDSVYYFKNNIVLLKYDTLGNVITYKEFKLDSSSYYVGSWGGGGFSKCGSGGYILAGDIQGSFYQQFLMRLNENFDTIWTKTTRKDTIISTINQCIETSTKSFLMCGAIQLSQSKFNVWLFKTDSLGNKLWEKTYDIVGIKGGAVDRAWNITETPDKGYLLGCYTYDMAYQGTGDGIVIKTDSMGNLQWTKNVGGPEKDWSASVMICNDSNYIIATVYSYFTEEYNDNWRGKLRLMKVNPLGYVIWDRQYEPEIKSLTALKVIEVANGDFVVGGTKYHQVSFYQGYFDSYLFKVNSNGDSIWYREYAKSTDTLLQTFNDLYNFELTPDGGFVACGKYMVAGQIPLSTWVFKTDSLGCLEPGCQNQVGVQEIGKTFIQLTVFPNPATTQATITYPVLTSQGQLQVYNTLGQMVYEEVLEKTNTQTVLDTRGYTKGLYKVVLREGGEIRGQASLIIGPS